MQRESDLATLSPESIRQIERIAARGVTTRVPFGSGATAWRRFGDGPPLVLLHGGGGAWLHWLRNIESLSRRYSLLVPDLPGHGESDLPDPDEARLPPGEPDDLQPRDWTGRPPLPIRVVARIVADAVAALVPEGPVRLAGFSFGGAVAGHAAEFLGDRAAAVVLIGAVGYTERPFGRPREVRGWRGITDRDAFRAAHRHNLETLLIADPAKVDELTVDIQIACTRQLATRRTERRALSAAALARAGVPVAGIWGAHDRTARSGLDAIRAALEAIDPAADLRIVPGAGHWVAWEAAAEVNALIPELLDGIAARRR